MKANDEVLVVLAVKQHDLPAHITISRKQRAEFRSSVSMELFIPWR